MWVCLSLLPLLGDLQWIGKFVDETCNHKHLSGWDRGLVGLVWFCQVTGEFDLLIIHPVHSMSFYTLFNFACYNQIEIAMQMHTKILKANNVSLWFMIHTIRSIFFEPQCLSRNLHSDDILPLFLSVCFQLSTNSKVCEWWSLIASKWLKTSFMQDCCRQNCQPQRHCRTEHVGSHCSTSSTWRGIIFFFMAMNWSNEMLEKYGNDPKKPLLGIELSKVMLVTWHILASTCLLWIRYISFLRWNWC